MPGNCEGLYAYMGQRRTPLGGLCAGSPKGGGYPCNTGRNTGPKPLDMTGIPGDYRSYGVGLRQAGAGSPWWAESHLSERESCLPPSHLKLTSGGPWRLKRQGLAHAPVLGLGWGKVRGRPPLRR